MPIGAVKCQRILMRIMTIRIMPHLQMHAMRKRACPAKVRGFALLQWPGARLVGLQGIHVRTGTREVRESRFGRVEAVRDGRGPIGPLRIDYTPNVPPFPTVEAGARGWGSLTDLSDLEPLRLSNEFTPQWGSASRERSASAKRPSPIAGDTERLKARRASPEPIGSTLRDEDMFDPADVHIHSTPESHRSDVIPRSGCLRERASSERLPERVEISTPPALRSHSSGSYQEARVKEVRGEASGSVVSTLTAFADQIRLLNGQVRREWRDENQQMRDRVSHLTTEVANQADADRMRLTVQRFAAEVIPDSRAIVRHAIDEQSVIIDERIDSLTTEVQRSVRNIESGMSQLHQVIEDKHRTIFRSQGAFQDQTNLYVGKFDVREDR